MPTQRCALLCSILLALAGCTATRGSVEQAKQEIEALLTRGEFDQAVRQSSALRAEYPAELGYEQLHLKATLGYLLAAGREATFENRDVEALEIFTRAKDMAPHSDQAQEWYEKTRAKLAGRWLVIGEEFHAERNTESALQAYQKALEYDPELLAAREGAAQLMLLQNHEAGLSSRYYSEGVRALHDYFLRISRARFQYTQKYSPGNERALAREDEVETVIAEQRFTQASKLELAGQFAAARNEYYIVLLMQPGNELAQAGYERMKVEAEAKRLLAEAEMALLRHDFVQGRELLERGRDHSLVRKETFEERLAVLDDGRIRATYEDAVTLERDFQFEAAAVLYRKILEERQWFEDVRARLSFVEERILKSAELYEQVQTATGEERLRILSAIEVLWPDYRDVRNQIRELSKTP